MSVRQGPPASAAACSGVAVAVLVVLAHVGRAAPPAAPPKAPLEAAPGTQRPLSIEKGPLGVTVYARLASAPYPHPEEPYSDDTVAIFIPSALQADGDGNLDVLLHLHGHYNNVGHVLATQRLREQLAETGRAPLLVLPQLPFDAEDSSPGFLGEAGGLARLLEEVFEVVREPSVQAALARPTPAGARPGRVVLSAHSGGYKAAGQAAKLGGVDVSEVWLFDGLFGQSIELGQWLAARRNEPPGPRRHRLVSYHRKNTKTADQTMLMMASLDAAGMAYLFEKREGQATRAEFTRARVVFVRTGTLHNDAVWAGGALADALRSGPFPELAKPRASDRRRSGVKKAAGEKAGAKTGAKTGQR